MSGHLRGAGIGSGKKGIDEVELGEISTDSLRFSQPMSDFSSELAILGPRHDVCE